jgi:hypothetical protein
LGGTLVFLKNKPVCWARFLFVLFFNSQDFDLVELRDFSSFSMAVWHELDTDKEGGAQTTKTGFLMILIKSITLSILFYTHFYNGTHLCLIQKH